MTFRKCRTCGEEVIIWDLDGEGRCLDRCVASYTKVVGIKLTAPEATEAHKQQIIESAVDLCKDLGTAQEAKAKLRMSVDIKAEPRMRVVKPDNRPYIERTIHDFVGSLYDKTVAAGFAQPEDGAEERYAARRARQTAVRHAFWWWVHNCVAHPLIGVAPIKLTFDFHTWTSKKLHGR